MDYLQSIHTLTHNSYPEFISHGRVSRTYWDRLFEIFLPYQSVLVDGREIVGVGNAIPMYVQNYSLFAENGWDWALQTGVNQHEQNLRPNVLVGLSVGISDAYRGQNLSSRFIGEFKLSARKASLEKVIIPIRPTKKHEFPSLTFEQYIDMKAGVFSFDPWIRVHERLGGKRLCTAKSSMQVDGSLAEWETWTGMRFAASGSYPIAGGLAPLVLDREKDYGIYIEPNLWIEHAIIGD